MVLKITSWNIKDSQKLAATNPKKNEQSRIERIWETLSEVQPDIICLIEGPRSESLVKDLCKKALKAKWNPLLLSGQGNSGNDKNYLISGKQWIWFLVNKDWYKRCSLQSPVVWRSLTGQKTWSVYNWGQTTPKRHTHYRHPQVLRVDIGGEYIELIGMHLKSKINKNAVSRDADGNIVNPYLKTALEARTKLATEARNVRRYIEARFEQSPSPGIVLMGDINDGPGQDWFEWNYMFFDLVGNLQGNVLNADRFFNHALFDFPRRLRWTAKYRDAVRKIPASKNPLLIDHILMSQPLVNGELPLVAEERSGKIEHEAFDRANAGSNSKTRSSDHRPVTLVLTQS